MTLHSGYIYCFSNESMPGIVKCGMTARTPPERLKEANATDTWRPPSSYTIEFAKKVTNPHKKEATLHQLLAKIAERPNTHREFFCVPTETVLIAFDLMDGEMWEEPAAVATESTAVATESTAVANESTAVANESTAVANESTAVANEMTY